MNEIANWGLLEWLAAGGAVAAILALFVSRSIKKTTQSAKDKSVNIGGDVQGDVRISGSDKNTRP